jgi:tetratricopeptide (TPR) repeat protein
MADDRQPPEADLEAQVIALCERGDGFAEAGAQQEAVNAYVEALRLLPEPIEDCDAATWILAAIADVCFVAGWWRSANRALLTAMNCPGAEDNGFLHLRHGQVWLELGDPDRAAAEMLRAYRLEGLEFFEDEDPKYLALLAARNPGIGVAGR